MHRWEPWWNRPEEDPSSGKLESSRTNVKSDQDFLVSSQSCVSTLDSLLIRISTPSTSGTLNNLTTDLIIANNNNSALLSSVQSLFPVQYWGWTLPPYSVVAQELSSRIYRVYLQIPEAFLPFAPSLGRTVE